MDSSKHQHLIDLSHTIEDGMITYKGLPGPVICDYWSREHSRQFYSDGTEFHVAKIEMVGNTGTYIDAPFHRFATGPDLAQLELARIVDLDCVIVRVVNRLQRAIDRTAIVQDQHDVRSLNLRGKAVLIQSGWDKYWQTEQYFRDHPFLTEDAAQFLVECGAMLVGIDSFNIDDTNDLRRPVHTILLGANIPIVEHLRNLGSVPARGARFFAVPAKVKGMGSFPVRAFAKIPE